jgi:hypothetical protein
MGKRPEPPHLLWLTYRHTDGRAVGVAVIESTGLLHPRLKASLAGADRRPEFRSPDLVKSCLEFASGHQLDRKSAGHIPANMIDQFLDDGDTIVGYSSVEGVLCGTLLRQSFSERDSLG